MAHELAHLILGTDSELVSEPFQCNDTEERDADRLAAQFLVPDNRLEHFIGNHLPVDARTLRRISQDANVSPVMAACRVVSASEQLGILNAAIIYFNNGVEVWKYSENLVFEDGEPRELLEDALRARPNLARSDNGDGNVNACSLFETTSYQLLLVQLLPQSVAEGESSEEKRRRLAKSVFGEEIGFQQSVAAVLGSVKQRCKGQSLYDAVAYFENHYLGTKYDGEKMTRLCTPEGREYVRIHLSRWFPD